MLQVTLHSKIHGKNGMFKFWHFHLLNLHFQIVFLQTRFNSLPCLSSSSFFYLVFFLVLSRYGIRFGPSGMWYLRIVVWRPFLWIICGAVSGVVYPRAPGNRDSWCPNLPSCYRDFFARFPVGVSFSFMFKMFAGYLLYRLQSACILISPFSATKNLNWFWCSISPIISIFEPLVSVPLYIDIIVFNLFFFCI